MLKKSLKADGAIINHSIPILVTNDVQSIAVGVIYSVILKTDGTLYTCGDNSNGQLGNGNKTNQHIPVEIKF